MVTYFLIGHKPTVHINGKYQPTSGRGHFLEILRVISAIHSTLYCIVNVPANDKEHCIDACPIMHMIHLIAQSTSVNALQVMVDLLDSGCSQQF